MNFRIVLAASALVLLAAGPARAAVLVTQPLAVFGDNALFCAIVNVSPVGREVTIQVFDFNGAEIDLPVTFIDVAQFVVASRTVGGASEPRTCVFTVEGAKALWRANACVLDFTLTAGCVSTAPAE